MSKKNNKIKIRSCSSANKDRPVQDIYTENTEIMKDKIKKLLKIIEKQKKIKKTLMQSETRFRELVEMLPELVFETDKNINLTYANKRFFKFTGYTEEDIKNRLYGFELFAPEDRIRAMEHLALRLKDDNYKIMEYNVLRKDGSVFPVLLHLNPIIKDGEIYGFRGVVVDITERKKAQEALRKSEERLDLAMSVANDGLWDWNLTTDSVYFDPRYYTMAGYKPDEFPHKIGEWSKRVHKEDIEKAEKEIEAYLAGESNSFDVEFRFRRKSGAWMWIRGRGKIVTHDGKGKALRMVGTHSDISKRKIAEEKLDNYKEHLEDLVKERTIELEKAKEKAEIASKSKSEFLANMSHELRTPLNAVIGFSELLSSMILDNKQKSYVQSIKVAGRNLFMLINDILDLSKIESGMLEIKNGIVNIKKLIEEIEQIFRTKTEKKGIELLFDIEKDIPELLILDEVRIKQVLLNLVGNSVKFTEAGYIKIIVKRFSEIKDENKIGLIIKVEDSGIGIPLQNLDDIFEAFIQHEGLDTKKFGGTGLGLSICKKLIRAMGGDINVNSILGRGTTFEIILKNINIALYDSVKVVVKDSFELDKTFFEEALILVVDDIESNRDLVEEILLKVGFKVITAENGKVALDLIHEKRPDFIFMDIRMPVLDGIKTILKIRENPETKSIPVVALTVFPPENRDTFLEKGFDEFLTKPFKVSKMLSVLSRFFKFSSSEIEAKTAHVVENIDFGDVKEAYELMKILNNEILSNCQYLKNVMIISKVKSFGQRIETIAENHRLKFLGKYGNNIVIYADNFDTVKIEEELDRLVKGINLLRKVWGDFDGE